jgi:hypothetical protein
MANIPQKQIGHELHNFFDHVTSHDPDKVHAAIVLVFNHVGDRTVDGEKAMEVHTCNFAAGDPQMLAEMIAMSIDSNMENIPGFRDAFQALLVRRRLADMVKVVGEAVKELKDKVAEEKGMEAAKPQVDELIARLKGNDTKH